MRPGDGLLVVVIGDTTHVLTLPTAEDVRMRLDAQLRAEKDADWWARHGPYLDAAWAEFLALGLV